MLLPNLLKNLVSWFYSFDLCWPTYPVFCTSGCPSMLHSLGMKGRDNSPKPDFPRAVVGLWDEQSVWMLLPMTCRLFELCEKHRLWPNGGRLLKTAQAGHPTPTAHQTQTSRRRHSTQMCLVAPRDRCFCLSSEWSPHSQHLSMFCRDGRLGCKTKFCGRVQVTPTLSASGHQGSRPVPGHRGCPVPRLPRGWT